jgi:hypothetical protein
MLGTAAKSRVATTDDCDAFQRLMLAMLDKAAKFRVNDGRLSVPKLTLAMLDQAVWASRRIRQILSF